jgi:uncharacterized membrane protein
LKSTWESRLQSWVEAGVVDAATAERIRAFEGSRAGEQKLRWPILLAVSLGGVLIGAGVLLFVAAHWDQLSPQSRFTLVLLMVGMFHAAGAYLSDRFSAMATVLHGLGTAALGAGIFLCGQIFNLQEHWPGGLMMWAAGAWVGWWLRRDWVQATFAALLTPAWLTGEWAVATEGYYVQGARIAAEGGLLLAITYLTARVADQRDLVRRALVAIGGVALIPNVLSVVFIYEWGFNTRSLPVSLQIVGWAVALGAPLLLALWLRGRAAWMNLIASVWVVLLGSVAVRHPEDKAQALAVWAWYQLGPYLLCALGALGLIAWGLRESRRERINLGVVGFGLTVLVFYFSNVMDKMGRATSLVGLGILFLLGGWALEKARRQLVARVRQG